MMISLVAGVILIGTMLSALINGALDGAKSTKPGFMGGSRCDDTRHVGPVVRYRR